MGDLATIQILLFFKWKLLCYHANQILVSITTRSPSASLQIKGFATKHITVKWPIEVSAGPKANPDDDSNENCNLDVAITIDQWTEQELRMCVFKLFTVLGCSLQNTNVKSPKLARSENGNYHG